MDQTEAPTPTHKQGFADLGFAKPDTARAARTGVAEVIYGSGKTAPQIATISRALMEAGQKCVLITRLKPSKAEEVHEHLAVEGVTTAHGLAAAFTYYEQARCGVVGTFPQPATTAGTVLIACAGTSDLPVAEEAALTVAALGVPVERAYDVGVAGIHRLLAQQERIAAASAIVAVAGMEGALPSVVAGLASCPVIAVPTSVGYGASFNGLAALLAMLNSCASGVSVVNIDNGFGAGYQAALIARQSTPRAQGGAQ